MIITINTLFSDEAGTAYNFQISELDYKTIAITETGGSFKQFARGAVGGFFGANYYFNEVLFRQEVGQ